MTNNTNRKKISVDIGYRDLDSLDQQKLYSALTRGMTRREAMTMMAAAGISIVAAGSVLTTAIGAVTATPKKGGLLKFATNLHGPADTLDPALNTGDIDYSRGRCIFNNLVQINDDLSTRPELATEFSANSDNSEWTFKLRKGVEFHDGSLLTADDVLYSMRRHHGEKSISKAKTLVADVVEWKKIDNHTIKAVLNGPNADLPVILGTSHFKIIKNGTTDFQNPVGTGPFTTKFFDPGVRSIHVRNEHYWREGAHVDQIEIFGITDSVARVNALVAGDIDLMMALDPKAIRQVESAPGVGVWTVPSGAYMGIACMTNTSPGNNHDFVLAMKYIQRRQKIVKSILKGQGSIGNDHPISSAYGADHCAELPVREYDLDKARFHLGKSGIKSAEVHVAEIDSGMTDICLFAQREASKIGLDLQIKKVPNDGYWGSVWQKTPINVTAWNMRPTANTMLNIAFAPDAPWNDTLWKDKRMGKLLKQARSVKDTGKRHEMYCAMQKLVHEDCSVIIPAHKNYLDGKSDRVQGIGRMPLGPLGGNEWPEFAWLEG